MNLIEKIAKDHGVRVIRLLLCPAEYPIYVEEYIDLEITDIKKAMKACGKPCADAEESHDEIETNIKIYRQYGRGYPRIGESLIKQAIATKDEIIPIVYKAIIKALEE